MARLIGDIIEDEGEINPFLRDFMTIKGDLPKAVFLGERSSNKSNITLERVVSAAQDVTARLSK